MNMWFWEFHFQRNSFNGFISCITAFKKNSVLQPMCRRIKEVTWQADCAGKEEGAD